jgi:hypothetical protein
MISSSINNSDKKNISAPVPVLVQGSTISTFQLECLCCFVVIILILCIILSITGTAGSVAREYAFFDGVKKLFSK